MATEASRPATKARPLPTSSHTPVPYEGPTREEVLAMRREYLSPGLITYYRDPLLVVEGHMQYLWDETGKQYLDAFAGIVTVSVGHCHPKIVEKVREQVGRLQHVTTIYLHPTIGQLGKKLAGLLPEASGLTVSNFTNSGSEANELAILMAREFTGNADVISLRNGYHGGTSAAMGLTAHGTWKFKSNPPAPVKYATPGYCYRCPYGLEYPSCDVKCARDIADLIRYETPGEVACFIAEPIQGVGGDGDASARVLRNRLRDRPQARRSLHCRRGPNRVRPDGDALLGLRELGGHSRPGYHRQGNRQRRPLSACVTRPEVARVMKNRIHFNTFGGNPISMTQGLATLEVIDSEGIQQNALTVGNHLKRRLQELQEHQPLIGEVRGMGLMLGVELVRDRQTKEPATTETAEVLERCKERGLLDWQGRALW